MCPHFHDFHNRVTPQKALLWNHFKARLGHKQCFGEWIMSQYCSPMMTTSQLSTGTDLMANTNPTLLTPCLPTSPTCWVQTPREQASSARSLHFWGLLSRLIPRFGLFLQQSYLLLSEEQLTLHKPPPAVATMLAGAANSPAVTSLQLKMFSRKKASISWLSSFPCRLSVGTEDVRQHVSFWEFLEVALDRCVL